MAVAWSPDDSTVVAGAADGTIRMMSVRSGRSTATCSAGTATAVLALAVHSDGTVVSGSAAGTTQFWSANGGLVASMTAHQGPVRAVSVARSGAVFSAGADPRVAYFVRVDGGADRPVKWVHACSRAAHTHDVSAMCQLGDLLVTGGVDSLLYSYDTLRFESAKPRYWFAS